MQCEEISNEWSRVKALSIEPVVEYECEVDSEVNDSHYVVHSEPSPHPSTAKTQMSSVVSEYFERDKEGNQTEFSLNHASGSYEPSPVYPSDSYRTCREDLQPLDSSLPPDGDLPLYQCRACGQMVYDVDGCDCELSGSSVCCSDIECTQCNVNNNSIPLDDQRKPEIYQRLCDINNLQAKASEKARSKSPPVYYEPRRILPQPPEDVSSPESPEKPSAAAEDSDGEITAENDKLLTDEQRVSLQQRIGELPADCFQGKRLTAYGGRAPGPVDPSMLERGVEYKAGYLGSTQLITACRPNRTVRMQQAHEAVTRIKAPDGEPQPCSQVFLHVSTQRIALVNVDNGDVILEHSLRSISYIADIANLIVIMARRTNSSPEAGEQNISRPSKIVCHILQSPKAQLVAQSIGQAFQLAYLSFLQAHGIEEDSISAELDYLEVLNSQQTLGDDVTLFASKEASQELEIHKLANQPLGLVVIESGWGSLVPSFVIAGLQPGGPAARSGLLNVGDQLLAIQGASVVGVTLSEVTNRLKTLKGTTRVRITAVRFPPTTSVLIKRPSQRYQLGFSVHDGVVCSLLRGGIAERGGVRVGHRIIEINNRSVVAVSHETIVEMLARSVGHIHMKTMPVAMYRLLTGQDSPSYL